MNPYIKELNESPYINHFAYIEGLKAELDAASQIADDLKLPLAGKKEFDELYDFVLARSDKLSEK